MVAQKFHRNQMAFCEVLCFLALTCLEVAVCVVHPDGISKVSHYQDDLGNFKFGYTVSSIDGEHFHKADQDASGRVIGSYGLTGPDGRQRVVDYVADQGGYRAHVRSNEPGLASSRSPALTVEKTDTGVGHLDFAASDSSRVDSSRANYGDRIRETSSRVSYVRPYENEQHIRRRPVVRPSSEEQEADSEIVERRGRTEVPGTLRRRPLLPGRERFDFTDQRPPAVNSARGFAPTISVALPVQYRPPLDPYKTMRPAVVLPPVNPSRNNPGAQQPSTPPYGGFETVDPFLHPIGNTFLRYPSAAQFPPRDGVTSYPAVSMSTIHGGYGNVPYPHLSRERVAGNPNILPYHERRNQYQPLGATLEGQRVPGRPNLIFRAVAIPNGIQAVPVDPTTGQVKDVSEFPLYNPRDHPGVRNADDNRSVVPGSTLSRNPEAVFRNYYGQQLPGSFERGQQDIPNRPRSLRNSSFYNEYDRSTRGRDETSLSRPSARDMTFVSRAIDHVNRHRNPNSYPPPPRFQDHRVDYPRYPEHTVQRDFFDDDFSDMRSEFGLRVDPAKYDDASGRDVTVRHSAIPEDSNAPDFERPYFDEPRFSNNRGYRSVSNKDDIVPSATEEKDDSQKASNLTPQSQD